MAMIDFRRNDIAEQTFEKDEQRLWSNRKNRKVLDPALRNLKTHLSLKFSPQFEGLVLPKACIAITKRAAVNAQFDGAVGSRIATRKKRRSRVKIVER